MYFQRQNPYKFMSFNSMKNGAISVVIILIGLVIVSSFLGSSKAGSKANNDTGYLRQANRAVSPSSGALTSKTTI